MTKRTHYTKTPRDVRNIGAIALYTFIFSCFFLLDRVTKVLAITYLYEGDIPIFYGLNFSLVLNKGISWGLLNNSSVLNYNLTTALIIIVIGLFIGYTSIEHRKNAYVGYEVMVLAGALSNLFDRLAYTYVIDFIDLYAGAWHWPTFNIADMCIILGVCGIIKKELWRA